MLFRVALLFAISWIMSLNEPLFEVPFMTHEGHPVGLSIKDLILLGGGLFLLYKSTAEIHHKLEGKTEHGGHAKKQPFSQVVLQIVLVNIVFSFDSILTAIGLTQEIFVMMVAVIASMVVMMIFAAPISTFINRHPTMQMLALSFLILIGVMLVAEAFHQHVSKGYIYFAIAFSLTVELLNMRLRKRAPHVVQLHGTMEQGVDEGIIKE
jgi:predicted tellurium resistance membrane protein TerC